jgi:hypothetical protein
MFPAGGRDPLDQANGTLPIDGTRNAADSQEMADQGQAGLYLSGDLEHVRGDVKFTDKSLHKSLQWLLPKQIQCLAFCLCQWLCSAAIQEHVQEKARFAVWRF